MDIAHYCLEKSRGQCSTEDEKLRWVSIVAPSEKHLGGGTSVAENKLKFARGRGGWGRFGETGEWGTSKKMVRSNQPWTFFKAWIMRDISNEPFFLTVFSVCLFVFPYLLLYVFLSALSSVGCLGLSNYFFLFIHLSVHLPHSYPSNLVNIVSVSF